MDGARCCGATEAVQASFRIPMRQVLRALAALVFVAGSPLAAQDPFEIQVYLYQTVPKGFWNLETHLNHVARGERSAAGTVAPSHNQTHLTFELTRGITDYFELAGYLVTARRKGVAVTEPLPSAQQVHQFFPGFDCRFTKDVILNTGVGFGATDVGNTLVYKMRFGWMFKG
jgi:hypothetical protein